MKSRLRIADNAVQPLLLMFPLGFFTLVLVFDAAVMTGAPGLLGTLAYWNIVAGLLGGAAAVGVTAIEAGSARHAAVARARTLGVLLDAGVLILFAVIALIRLRTHERGADSGLLLLEGLGLVAAGLGTWLGGRLGPLPAFRSAHDCTCRGERPRISAG
jgi:uncharacterized membrane protein